jgi:hypothetical protein
MASLFGKVALTYTPDADPGPGTPVDLSCYVRPGVEFDSPIETIDDPVLCDPTRSRTRAGAASVSFTLVVGDDWATKIVPLLGTSGVLEARVPDEDGPGFSANVSWPSGHPVIFTEDGFVEVEMTLGAGGIAPLAATAP